MSKSNIGYKDYVGERVYVSVEQDIHSPATDILNKYRCPKCKTSDCTNIEYRGILAPYCRMCNVSLPLPYKKAFMDLKGIKEYIKVRGECIEVEDAEFEEINE